MRKDVPVSMGLATLVVLRGVFGFLKERVISWI